jgi:hypothetical protein
MYSVHCSSYVFLQVYVEYVVKNPVLPAGEFIDSELFIQKLDELVKGSLCYTSKTG